MHGGKPSTLFISLFNYIKDGSRKPHPSSMIPESIEVPLGTYKLA